MHYFLSPTLFEKKIYFFSQPLFLPLLSLNISTLIPRLGGAKIETLFYSPMRFFIFFYSLDYLGETPP